MRILALILITTCIVSSPLFAAESDAQKKEVTQMFVNGKYQDVIKTSQKYIKNKEIRKELNYMVGLSYNRLGQYDKGANALKLAIGGKFEAPGIYFELGQAQFAMRTYQDAKKSFTLSRKAGYKADASLFYIGSCEELLKNKANALKVFNELAKDPKADADLRKSSWKKIIENELAPIDADKKATKEEKSKMVEAKVLPLFDQAEGLDDLKAKIQAAYASAPPKQAAKKEEKWWSLGASQDLKYDSNVISQSDDATSKQSNTGSTFFKSELEGSGNIKLPWEIDTKIRVRGNTTWYQEDDKTIRSNDNDAFTPSAKFERSLKEALGGFDLTPSVYLEYSYNRKDWQKRAENDYFTESVTGGLGVAGNWTGLGNSSVEARYKALQSYATTSDSNTWTVIATQSAKLPWGHAAVLLYTGTFLKMPKVPTKDTDSHLFRLDYVISDLYWMHWDVGLSYTFTDTKAQSVTRGTETEISPSLKVGKKFLQYFDVAGLYEYHSKDSDDVKNYKYDKSIYGLEASFKY